MQAFWNLLLKNQRPEPGLDDQIVGMAWQRVYIGNFRVNKDRWCGPVC